MITPSPSIDPMFAPVLEARSAGPWQARNLIGGRWRASTQTFSVRSPIDGEAWVDVPKATVSDVDAAIAAAHEAQSRIRDIPAVERIALFERAAALLERHQEFFRELLLVEAGKPRGEAHGEVAATIERLRMTMQEVKKITGEYIPGDWAADTMGKVALVIHEPLGTVGAITSFNYPLYIPAAKLIPALLAGNSVVVKPASAVPVTLLCFVRLLEEAGFPPSVVNAITGSGDVGDRLVGDSRIDVISFTGSTPVGKHIATTAGLKRLHLELGGKGAAIVLEDADLDLAARKCVEGSLKNAGQRCDAVSAVLVVERVADLLVERMRRLIEHWPAGDPRQPDTKVGPVINREAAIRIQSLIDDAQAKGARVLAGGTSRECYVQPTLLDRVPLSARIASEETFGPVVTVIRMNDEAEALEAGQRSGLDASVFTHDFYRMWKIAKRLNVGSITINDFPRHGTGYFPFGGVGESGMGQEGIGYSIEAMTRRKTVVFNLEPGGLGKTHRIERM